ncbi:MAG: hypothetical protein ACRDBP_09200 [Luteolibacter sp.]
MACPGFPWAAAKTQDLRVLSNITIEPEHTSPKTYYVGLDVHKETIAIAYVTGGTRDEPVYHGPCGGSVIAAERALRKLAEKIGVEFSALKVCYEAGPTGFVLIHLGLECVLMSPSKTERKPNEKIKTDKRDACKIARN